METKQLAELTPGQSAIVSAVVGNSRISTRLMEMGLVPGVAVEVLRKAPFGDPVQYRVRGTVISMRASEAAFVTVSCELAFSAQPVASARLAMVAG